MFRLEKKFSQRDPPTPRNSKHLLRLRGGRCASCVHAGGLSYICEKRKLSITCTYVADEQEENLDILEEAAAIRSVQMMLGGDNSLDYSDITVTLLTELQDTQDHELAQALQKIHGMVRYLILCELDYRAENSHCKLLCIVCS